MSSLSQKSVSLVANTRNTLTWQGADIANYTGGQSVLQSAYDVSVLIVNSTTHVVYVDFAYTTQADLTTALQGGLVVGAVNAGTTAQINLGSIPPGVMAMTVGLISQASGTVTAQLILGPVADSQNIGAQERVISDYIVVAFQNTPTIAGGTNVTNTLYTVPTGKRAQLLYADAWVDVTPSQPTILQLSLQSANGAFYLLVYSERDRISRATLQPTNIWLESGDSAQLSVNNQDSVSYGIHWAIRLNETL